MSHVAFGIYATRISNIIRGTKLPGLRCRFMTFEAHSAATLRFTAHDASKRMARRLQALPEFALPADTQDIFREYLKRLDDVAPIATQMGAHEIRRGSLRAHRSEGS